MRKKILVALIALMGTFSVGYAYYNQRMAAASVSSGGTVTGSLGALKSGNHFYINTNNYSFVVVGNDQGNSNMGTLALSDTAIGSVKWDNGSNYYSASDYRKFVQSMNDTIDSRDVNMIIKEFVKPQLPAGSGDYWMHDFNALPSNEMPYFIGVPYEIAGNGILTNTTLDDCFSFFVENMLVKVYNVKGILCFGG